MLYMKNKWAFTRLISIFSLLTLISITVAGCASMSGNNSQETGSNLPDASSTVVEGTNDNGSGVVDNPSSTSVATITPVDGVVADPANQGEVSFTKDILPIFQKSCVSCHGGEKTSKGLDLKTFASLMAGSQNGQIIVAGDATSSKLVQAIQSGKMPKRGEKLSHAQLDLLINWVNSGAKDN
jgi:hypothetical protein